MTKITFNHLITKTIIRESINCPMYMEKYLWLHMYVLYVSHGLLCIIMRYVYMQINTLVNKDTQSK